jgi:hypothetical protein
MALLTSLAPAAAPAGVSAQGAKKSDALVKATATAGKPDADGKQDVTVTLTVDKPWHIYANPVGLEDLADAQTTVTFDPKAKPLKVQYPEGKVIKDKVLGDYRVYEDKVTIKAQVRRARGETGPLQVSVKVQACNDKTCLLPAVIKLTVP